MDIAVSIVAGTITYLGFGYVVFELLLGKYTKKNTLNLKGFNKPEKETSMLFLTVSCAAYAVLITFILYNWGGSSSLLQSFLASGLIGSLVAMMANSYWYSTTYLYKSLAPLFADVAAAFVTVGVMGAVISLII